MVQVKVHQTLYTVGWDAAARAHRGFMLRALQNGAMNAGLRVAQTFTGPTNRHRPPEQALQTACRFGHPETTKPNRVGWAALLIHLGWLMGLEPTTTGITILDSTN
jgi:hypothetical protein